MGEFIRLYLTRYRRWTSPLFLVGESYGTTRAAGLAGHLIDRGVAFNGIVLVSSILNFQTAEFNKGNDLPYALFLPTYTATAWYHKRLAPDLQQKALKAALSEAEAFAGGPYVEALARGDRLPADRRQRLRETSRGSRACPRSTSSKAICASRSSGSARSCCGRTARPSGGSTAGLPASMSSE